MTATASTESRLGRLEAWLLEDPGNPLLRAQAWEVALAHGLHERALTHVLAAESLGLEPDLWCFRRAQVCIAARELEEAARLLESLCARMPPHAALSHDLAWVRFLQADLAGCRSVLQPWIAQGAEAAPAEARSSVQVLWLRATHRLQLLGEAMAWIAAAQDAGHLVPEAQGIASLIALDADAFAQARSLAEAALAVLPQQAEALVARACVALAEEDSVRAQTLLQAALAGRPEDGRVWSALGLASLQAQQLGQAQQQLERALLTVPEHIGTWHALGWTRLLRQDLGGATAAFRSALARDRNFAESHGALALMMLVAGDVAQAEEHLARADRLDRNNVTGRYARALRDGAATDAASLRQLAVRLLDRPGFFGGRLAQAVQDAVTRQRPH